MAEERRDPDRSASPIAFAPRLAGSESFRAMFREGMALVEETATYLDGDGRRDSRRLSRAASLAYATESMRLTTRLMQLASWLLLQRAVNEGEMSAQQAGQEKAKVKLGGLSTAIEGPGWDGLPPALQALIARSVALQGRIRRIEQAMQAGGSPPADNPVARQIGEIARAFAAGGR